MLPVGYRLFLLTLLQILFISFAGIRFRFFVVRVIVVFVCTKIARSLKCVSITFEFEFLLFLITSQWVKRNEINVGYIKRIESHESPYKNNFIQFSSNFQISIELDYIFNGESTKVTSTKLDNTSLLLRSKVKRLSPHRI